MVYEIKLNSPKDVEKLNKIASKYNGSHLTVNCDSTIVDVKSILALFALIGRKNIKLVAPDHDNPNDFLKIVKKLQS